MIKILMLMKRKDGVPVQDFDQFLMVEFPSGFTSWNRCQRYVKYDIHQESPQLAIPPPLELTVDAIDEIWFEDKPNERELPAVAQFEQRLAASRISFFIQEMKLYRFEEYEVKTIELPEQEPRSYLKRLVPLTRRSGSTHEQFLHHWNTVHAPLLKAVRPGPVRYCQLCVRSEVYPPAGVDTMAVDIDGFSESWFLNEREMNFGRNTPEGIALVKDNAIYVGRSKRIFFDELELHNRVSN